MIQATVAIGDFLLILMTSALWGAAQLAGVAAIGAGALGGAALGGRALWRRRGR
ncbi:MAG: hypothetical protein PGN09_02780 [Sphingomonas fennica]